MNKFTAKQREVIARKMGYDGPMQGFDTFLQSSPSLSTKYNMISDKLTQRMAKGGLIKKYQVGGDVTRSTSAPPAGFKGPEAMTPVSMALVPYYNPTTGETWTANTGGWTAPEGWMRGTPPPPVTQTPPQSPPQTDQGTKRPMGTEFTDIGGVPQVGGAAQMTAAQITEQPDQFLSTAAAPTTATTAQATTAPTAAAAAAPSPITTATTTAATAAPAVGSALDIVQSAQGAVSDKAQVAAQTGAVSPQALSQAAQGQATQVVAPTERTAQAGEMVSGTAVDMARAEQALAQSQAAQGVVSEEMTVQGQLNKLLTDFDAGSPPAWASASMRAATAQLAARGLGTSSLAGQAVIQAAMEAAVPIASQDAQVFQQMGLQNLSNKQQMAVLTAQQRAQFLGQEFDQSFQSRVINAAKVSEIANMNFTASQQIALENARLAQTMDLANLSNEQASVMANAATFAAMDMANLNNRQQAAVVNAQSFLQLDMANLSNEQQTTLFKAQAITNSLLSDASAENASRQFNASSTNQTNQFMSSLSAQVSQFNAAQRNAVDQFNVDQVNALNKFNAETQNQRDQFNANQRLVIDQANAQWRREISTANTAAINAANYLNAQNLQNMTLAEYNNETQLYRDQVQMAWQSFENDANRITTLAAAEIAGKSETDAASIKSKSDMWKAIGEFAAGFDW